MLMADALPVGFSLVKIAPAELKPESCPQDAAPKLGHLVHVDLPQLLHGFNPQSAESLFHPSANSGQVARREREENVGKLALREGYQSIRLLHGESDRSEEH